MGTWSVCVMVYQRIYGSRYVAKELLHHNAQERYVQGRARTRDIEDEESQDRFLTHLDQDNKFNPGYQIKLMRDFIGAPDREHYDGRDKNYMKSFLLASKNGRIPDVSTKERSIVDLFPGGAPLVYSMIVEKERNPFSWQYPSKTCLDEIISHSTLTYDSLDSVSYKEITVGRSSGQSVDDFLGWVMSKIRSNRYDFPAVFLPVSLHKIVVPDDDFKEYMSRCKAKNPAPVKVKVLENSEDHKSPAYLPARITFGGNDWIGSIRFNYTEVSDYGTKYYLLHAGELQPEVQSLLRNLPIWFGDITSEDKERLQLFFKECYDVQISLPDLLDPKSLAAAAGWQLETDDLFTLNLLCTGGLINTQAFHADGHWAMHWERLPKEFQLYAIGMIRASYHIFVILMALLLGNFFPEPEIMCSLLELNQEDCIRFLTSFCSYILKNKSPMREGDRSTREKLLGDIGVSSLVDARLMEQFVRLIPSWASIPDGGARYLHTARSTALKQYAVIKTTKFEHGTLAANLTRDVTDELGSVYMYGRDVNVADCGEPLVGSGLQCNPCYREDLLCIDIDVISDTDLEKVRSQSKISRVLGVLEWGRLNVNLIDQLMRRLRSLSQEGRTDSFWFKRTVAYDGLRAAHKRVMTFNTIKVQVIEDVIQKARERVQADSEALVKKKEKSLQTEEDVKKKENAQLRADLFQTLRSEDRDTPRVAQHQIVHLRVPGDNYERNKRWSEKRKAKKAAKKSEDGYIPEKKYKSMKISGEIKPKPKPAAKLYSHHMSSNSRSADWREKKTDLRVKLETKYAKAAKSSSRQETRAESPQLGSSSSFRGVDQTSRARAESSQPGSRTDQYYSSRAVYYRKDDYQRRGDYQSTNDPSRRGRGRSRDLDTDRVPSVKGYWC